MRSFLLLQLVAMAICLQAADISEVPGTRAVGQVPAFSQYGRIQLQAAEALVQLPPAKDGRRLRSDLIAIFDPITKHFLWRTGPSDPSWPLIFIGMVPASPSHAIYSSPDRITWWQILAMVAEVRLSTETADSLDKAFELALSEFKAGWESHYSKGELPNYKQIDFSVHELADFQPETQAVPPPPTIEEITHDDHGYRIRVRGQWRGEVVIGDDMTVKERFHRVMTKQP